jgi:hypothetical protein
MSSSSEMSSGRLCSEDAARYMEGQQGEQGGSS